MNENELFEAIGETDDEMLSSAEEKTIKGKSFIKWAGAAAACLCIVFIGYGIIHKIRMDNYVAIVPPETPLTTTAPTGAYPEENLEGYSEKTNAMLVSAAVYPEMPDYPDESNPDWETFNKEYEEWRSFIQNNRKDFDKDCSESVNSFTERSAEVFLTDTGDENKIISPVNIYFALGMLAETADGESRQQILDLLGIEDSEKLQECCNTLWHRNYSNDKAFISIAANSLWLSDTLGYDMKTVNTLAEKYFADTFSGDVADENYSKAFQEWLNVKTGGLLEAEANQQNFDPQTVFSLASTVYFRAKWSDTFKEESTKEDIFHTADGKEVACEFMNEETTGYYYWGDNYTAVSRIFSGGAKSRMWFILPDEGYTTDDVIKSGALTECVGEKAENKRIITHISIPKFDSKYSLDLKEGLAEMGITDVFDGSKADFSALLNESPVSTALSAANHAARVTIDEEGCTATAFTAIMAAGAALPPTEEVYFTADRPFIFAITGPTGDTLFAGIINNPTT